MKAQELGKSKPSTAKWVCLRCSRQQAAKDYWAGWLDEEQDLLARQDYSANVCAGCITFCREYVEQVMSEPVEPPHPPGLPPDNIAGPPPPPPLGASGLALANNAPSRAEFEELQRTIHDVKRRQARLYMERREQSWGSLHDYLDSNVAASLSNLDPSNAESSPSEIAMINLDS